MEMEVIVKTKWKQMMAIPEKYKVQFYVEDENGEEVLRDVDSEGWTAPCLVLYERVYSDKTTESGIALYLIDSNGVGELETDYRLVLKDDADK